MKKKAKTILLPYVCFSLIFLSYQFAKSLVFSGSEFNLLSGIVSMLIPISGRMTTTVYGLWFLPCLFFAEASVRLLAVFYKKKRLYAILVALFGMGICLCSYVGFGVASVLSVLPIAVLFILFGVWIYKRIEKFKRYKVLGICVCSVVFSLSTLLNYLLGGSGVDLSSMRLGIWPLYLMCSASGTLVVIFLSVILNRVQLIQWIGQNSLYYYGLHYEIIGVAEKIISGGVSKPCLFLLY